MRVWIVQIGEPLPIDGGNPRPWRSGLLARHLAKRGHEVLWWASTFEHRTKTHRRPCDSRIQAGERLSLLLLHSPGYSGNVSLARLKDHRILGERFKRLAEQEPQPDVIHCGFPTIDLSLEAARYGKRHAVPVVLDIRDLWPDIFLDALPAFVRPLAQPFVQREYLKTREAFRLARVVSGHTPGYVHFGLNHAGRPATPLDRPFPFAYPNDQPSDHDTEEAFEFWRQLGITAADPFLTICFLGSFGVQQALDLMTPIRAARLLAKRGARVRFIFCGSGPTHEKCRREAEGLPNVVLPGWIGYAKMWTLMRLSHLGLVPYLPSKDFLITVPNKTAEYLSGSLPVLTCLTGGHLEKLLKANHCGHFYQGRDVGSLVTTIERVLDQQDNLKEMRERAKNLFTREFAEDKVCEEMADHLEMVVRQEGQA